MSQALSIPSPKTGPLSGSALKGMAWMSGVIVVTKLSGFATQWILGLLLFPKDFGLYALATVGQSFIEGFRDIGASRILIQRGHEFDRLASPVLKLSLIANAIAIVAMLAITPVFARYYSEPGLYWLIPLIALSLPWTTVAVVYKSKASRDLNYALVGKIESSLPLFQNALMIALAWSGAGVLSFVIPMTATAIVQMIAYRRSVGPLAAGAPLTRPLFWEIFHMSKWLMLGAYAMGLVIRGDYLVLGRLFENRESLGIYFFGFQLAASIGILFTSSLQNVLMPAFSKLAAEPARLQGAYERSLRMLLFCGTLLTGGFVAISPEAIQLLWSGKWNAATPVAIAITFSLVFKLLAPIGSSAMEARGLWRQRTLIILIDGVTVCFAAALGAWWHGIVGAAVCVGAQRCLIGLLQSFYAAANIGLELSAVTRILIRGFAPFILGLAAVLLQPFDWLHSPVEPRAAILHGTVKGILFVTTWLAASFVFNRGAINEVRTLLAKK